MTRPVALNGRFLSQQVTGVQRYARELVTALDGLLCREDVSREEPFPTLLSSKETAKADLDLRRVSFRSVGRSGGNLWVQVELPLAARDAVLWSPTNTGPILHKRHVVTIHDVAALEHPEWFSAKFAAWYGFLLPRLARRAARVLTVSEFSRQRLAEFMGIDPERISLVPNGVNPTFRPLPEEIVGPVLSRLGVPPNYVLALGSLEPRKNLLGLLKAWSLLLSRRSTDENTFLVVAGGKGRSFRDVAFEAMPQKVVFTGYVEDEYLPALYSGASAFVFPSFYEGFGLPPLEAMACGVPVVTSNLTSIPEVTGDAALLVDPGDVESMAQGLQTILNDANLRDALRTAGLARAKLFGWENSARLAWEQVAEVAAEG